MGPVSTRILEKNRNRKSGKSTIIRNLAAQRHFVSYLVFFSSIRVDPGPTNRGRGKHGEIKVHRSNACVDCQLFGLEQYRFRGNLVNKLKRKSENNYFEEKCTGGCKQTEFWKTMKPYFSKKSCGTQSKIILQDNDKIVTKNVDVAEVFNKLFVNVAQDIGKDYTFNRNDHPSLQKT